MTDHDYYHDLGVTEYATTEEIKSAFFALAKQYHPDKTGTNDATAFRRVREAYNVLADPESRTAYDSDYKNSRAHEAGYEAKGTARTRTAEYEAEEAAKTGKYDHNHGPEPADYYEDRFRYQQREAIPTYSSFAGILLTTHSPFHFFFQGDSASSASSSSGSAHGLAVKMSFHPATTERCTVRPNEWRTQIAGTEICVFYLSPVEKGGSRCPGCEVMACGECLGKIIALERGGAFGFGG